jgi:pimeloyl-ACP methyl ester carboxylesterase
MPKVWVRPDLELAYDEQGDPDGPPVVLLPGYADSHRFFEPLLPHLGVELRVLALTLRGHGDSDKPEVGYDLATLAGDVIGFLDALSLERVVLVGHSSGGLVAQQLCCDHPGRVRGQVLVGAPLDLRGLRPPFADVVERMTDPVDPELVREMMGTLPLTDPAVTPEYVEEMVAESAKVPAQVWRTALDELRSATPPTEGDVPDVRTLVVAGEEDVLLGPEAQEALAEAWDARLVVLPDAGHLVAWEQPESLGAGVTAFAEAVTRGERRAGSQWSDRADVIRSRRHDSRFV